MIKLFLCLNNECLFTVNKHHLNIQLYLTLREDAICALYIVHIWVILQVSALFILPMYETTYSHIKTRQ
jgi:hypothetical protein